MDRLVLIKGGMNIIWKTTQNHLRLGMIMVNLQKSINFILGASLTTLMVPHLRMKIWWGWAQYHPWMNFLGEYTSTAEQVYFKLIFFFFWCWTCSCCFAAFILTFIQFVNYNCHENAHWRGSLLLFGHLYSCKLQLPWKFILERINNFSGPEPSVSISLHNCFLPLYIAKGINNFSGAVCQVKPQLQHYRQIDK